MFRKFAYIIQKNLNLKRSFDTNKDITKEKLQSYIKQGAIIIDVRSSQEYKEGHVDGAISIPDYKIKKEASKIKSKPPMILCVNYSAFSSSEEVTSSAAASTLASFFANKLSFIITNLFITNTIIKSAQE